MRKNLAVVALGLLGIVGCAHRRTCDAEPQLNAGRSMVASPMPQTGVAVPGTVGNAPKAVPPVNTPMPPPAPTPKVTWPAETLPTPKPAPAVVPEKKSDQPPEQTPPLGLPEAPQSLPDRPTEVTPPPLPPLPQVPSEPRPNSDAPAPGVLPVVPPSETGPILPGAAKSETPPATPAFGPAEKPVPSTVPIQQTGAAEKPAVLRPLEPAGSPAGQTAAPTVAAQAPVTKSEVLIGTVEAWRKTWRLRYAAPDVEDANGGRVTLTGDVELDRLQEGQRIRVHGFTIPAVDRTCPPTFHVQSVELLK